MLSSRGSTVHGSTWVNGIADYTAGFHTFAVDWEPTYLDYYIDGVLRGGIPLGAGNLFSQVSDTLTVAPVPGFTIDEVEIWERDLASDGPETLCVNGFDGEWNFATSTCLLTSN